MHLKQFEAGRYEDQHVVIHNPANDQYELFNNDQFEIVKFLKQNEDETLLALLLPNIGVAKKDHILLCLKVLAKLKKMQIVDYFSIIGKFAQSNTGTVEIAAPKKKLEIGAGKTFSTFVFGVFEKIFSVLGPNGLNLLVFLLAGFSFILFPISKVESDLAGYRFAYTKFFLIVYLTGSAAFTLRALFRAAYVKSCGREIENREVGFVFPFLSLLGKPNQIWMTGYQSRLQMAVLGIFSPLALSIAFTLLAKLGLISSFAALTGFSTCVGISLILSCPIFPSDMAEILHVIFHRDQIQESISTQYKEMFKARVTANKSMIFSLCFLLFWLFIWFDSIRGFWEIISAQVVSDFFDTSNIANLIGSWFISALVVFLFATPLVIFIFNIIKERLQSRGKRLIVTSEKLKDSLTFEERMTALEKIPLFAYLNDQERLSLLNQMTVSYYNDGKFLVHQGEVGKEFLVLVKGRANAYFTDVQGKAIHLANLAEGDAFGEIALIDDVPRTASIVSEGGCIALVLKKEGFDKFAAGLGTSDRVKTMIRLTSFFRRHPLFSKLSAKDQAQLIDSFQFHTLLAGDEVVDAENDDNFYVIYSGKVRVDTGDDRAETMLEPDDCFGYTNALKAKYYAVEGTGLLSVPTDLFHKLIWEKLVEKPELFI